jgi:hypothetical protein
MKSFKQFVESVSSEPISRRIFIAVFKDERNEKLEDDIKHFFPINHTDRKVKSL